MIRNDLHVHSIRSLCGFHTILEIVEIAAKKGMRSVNICDHGKASGKEIKFDVFNNKYRFPRTIQSVRGNTITIMTGIEVNNTKLRLKKTDVGELKDMIDLALEKGAALSENSDGHTIDEIGENEQIEKLLRSMRLNGNDVFFNRNDKLLHHFLEGRTKIRVSQHPSG